VAALYADFLGGWLVDDSDADIALPTGVTSQARPLLMTDLSAAADIAGAALDLGGQLARS
jgi:LPPG:FO 2-phospho-L-lactate transferase